MTEFLFVAKPETEPDLVRRGIRTDWSCSSEARKGDRALVYVTKRGIVAEWIIDSDAWKDEKRSRCKVQFLREIEPPVTIRDLKKIAPDWKPIHPPINLKGYWAISIPKDVSFRIYEIRPRTLESEDRVFEDQIKESLKLSDEDISSRLNGAAAIPEKVTVTQSIYKRNPDVVVAVLRRAQGKCELCHAKAPFLKKNSQEPYLEVHHKLWLSKGGEDTVSNAIALCPNCHRREHYA